MSLCVFESTSLCVCVCAHALNLSMEFSRQEYWSRLPFPIPGDLPDQGLNLLLVFPTLQADYLSWCHLYN